MSSTDQRSTFPTISRFHVGVVVLLTGIACILTLARVPGTVTSADPVLALLSVASLTAGTVAIGTSE